MSKNRKFVFIDRDGVINKDPGGWTEHSYVTRWEDFHFIQGSKKAIKKLAQAGYGTIIISNQAGVAKGFFTKEELSKVNSRMLDEITHDGGRVEEVYYCLHRDEDNCDCRKPKTGLFERAAKKYGINLKETYFVGDGLVDTLAGKKIGARTVLVLSGKTPIDDMNKWPSRPDLVFKDLLGFVNWLAEKEKRKAVRASRRKE